MNYIIKSLITTDIHEMAESCQSMEMTPIQNIEIIEHDKQGKTPIFDSKFKIILN